MDPQTTVLITLKPSIYILRPCFVGHVDEVKKVGKCTAESPGCGEDEDVKGERGRVKHQTVEEAGEFPLCF